MEDARSAAAAAEHAARDDWPGLDELQRTICSAEKKQSGRYDKGGQ